MGFITGIHPSMAWIPKPLEAARSLETQIYARIPSVLNVLIHTPPHDWLFHQSDTRTTMVQYHKRLGTFQTTRKR